MQGWESKYSIYYLLLTTYYYVHTIYYVRTYYLFTYLIGLGLPLGSLFAALGPP